MKLTKAKEDTKTGVLKYCVQLQKTKRENTCRCSLDSPEGRVDSQRAKEAAEVGEFGWHTLAICKSMSVVMQIVWQDYYS